MKTTRGSTATRGNRTGLSWSFQIGWVLFVITTWALVAVVVNPRVLRRVGADGLSTWLLAHAWVRWVLAPILLPFIVLSVSTPSQVPPGTPDDPDSDPIDPALGLRQGGTLSWRFGPHTVEAATWRARRESRFVARGKVRVESPFAFSARSSRDEPAWMRGMAQKALRHGLRANVDPSRTDQLDLVQELDFLSKDPIRLGLDPLSGALVLRADHPDRARALFARSAVTRAVRELERGRCRWSLSLLPSGEPGVSELYAECRGTGRAERERLLRGLLSAVLESLPAPPADPTPRDS